MVWELGSIYIPGVDPFQARDFGPGLDFRVQLVASDVHAGDMRCAPLNETIGETAGRSPDVECPQAGNGDVVGGEKAFEFLASTAHKTGRLNHTQRGVVWQ